MNALHTAALNVIPVTRASGTADDHNIPGWNDIIKAAHSDARDAFKFWIRSSKPRQGEVFDSMRISRAKFKYLLRKCRREEAPNRADIQCLSQAAIQRHCRVLYLNVAQK